MNRGNYWAVLFTIAAAVLTSIFVSVKTVPAQDVLAVKLQNLAEQQLRFDNETLINGSREEPLQQRSWSSRFRVNMGQHLQQLNRLHDANSRSSHPYVRYETEVQPMSFELGSTGATAILKARELTKLYLDRGNDPETPEYTASALIHTFSFVMENGEWRIENDQVPDVTHLAPPVPSPTEILPVPESDPTPPESAGDVEAPGRNRRPILPEIARPALTKYNVTAKAVVNYAVKYWNNYNTAYHSYPDDCTNFASQSLRAGGWQYISGFYTSNSVWWYTGGAFGYVPPYASYTWAGANNLNQFMWSQYGNRATFRSMVANLQPGDILIANWDHDNLHFHSMVVTAKDSSGELYITEHTDNHLNKKFFSVILPQILLQHPNTSWYAWGISSSFNL